MTLSRRQFLGAAGSAVGTAATGGLLWKIGTSGDSAVQATPTTTTSLPATTTTATTVPTTTPNEPTTTTTVSPGPESNRVLVVVQMAGGNDGLNSFVPTDGRYRDARPTIAIAETDLVALQGVSQAAFHPSLAPLEELWANDQLSIVQGLALPDQSRSHFVALDTWWAATPELAAAGGWLGRWLDATSSVVDGGDAMIRAVSLGGGSPALTGERSRPVIVSDIEGFVLESPRGTTGVVEAFSAMANPMLEGHFGDAQAAIPAAVGSVEMLTRIFADTPSADVEYEVENLFHAAASIIEADIGTEVILINLRGFDTHSDQLSRHIELLGGVANGIAAMFGRLEVTGHADRTVTMAYSEFGRRVAENGSGGTDHGSGGLAFVAGPSVAGAQVVGDVNLGSLDRGDIIPTIDTRSLYADVLDWLGGPTEEVLGGRFDSYALL